MYKRQLSATGVITYGSAIPIIMGQNIGTCVTALLSSVGTTKNARRAAVVHLMFNIIGTVVCLTLFVLADALFSPAILGESASYLGIAICHTVFNVICTTLMPVSYTHLDVYKRQHLLRAESPGPTVSKMVPNMRKSAAILYGIYIVMTAVEVVLLLLGGCLLYTSRCV